MSAMLPRMCSVIAGRSATRVRRATTLRSAACRHAYASATASSASAAGMAPHHIHPAAASAYSTAASSSSAAVRPAASSSSSSLAPAAASTTAPADLYRSPLRSTEDQTFAHLWEDMWVLDPPNAQYSVIWLHGLGQSSNELRGMAEVLAPAHTRFLVPQAPKIGITCLPDAPDQRAWFDLLEEKRDAAKEAAGEFAEDDEFGLDEMTARVHELIAHEMSVSKLPSHRILLAGFGEGGALALQAGLSFPTGPLAGILSFSGYLASPSRIPDLISTANADTPVLAVHGNSDFIVPVAFAKQRYQALVKAKVPFELRTEWSMGHFLSNTSLMATHGWMADRFKRADKKATGGS